MKNFKLLLLSITILFCTTFHPQVSLALEAPNQSVTEVTVEQTSQVVEAASEDESSFAALFFIVTSLIIGAAVRHFFRKVPLPFTVILLLIGLATGIATRMGVFGIYHLFGLTINFGFLEEAFHWAAHISPHLLLYIFLPILIFEAAFAMDVHTFKKTVVNAVLLAVPGIIIAIAITAAICMGLVQFRFLGGWEWPMAFMFGAVISATDPVAVVALLKGLGASKKLGTLIEGESMLNDGTAIVIFMVFLVEITGSATGTNSLVEFIRVSFGGAFVGLLIAFICIIWIKKVFNDALVEISVIVAGAFLTFFVAEHFLHVSGVLGLVAMGLAMASYGRTRISPQVVHFLHNFWDLAAFMANVIIFIIVGLVIPQRINFTADDFVVLGVIYIGIHIARAAVIGSLYPFMKKIGYGINPAEAIISWYGGLRGAVGLALALIVVDEEVIPESIRENFLFITAGIVTLTLFINATTIKWVVTKLGVLKVPPAKALMVHNARMLLRKETEQHVENLHNSRFLKKTNWIAVANYMPELPEYTNQNYKVEIIQETRRRILEHEKSSYWKQFEIGSLGKNAVRTLASTIDDLLDKGGDKSLANRADLEDLLQTPKSLARMQKWKLIGGIVERMFYERLANSYDMAIGFLNAQEDCNSLLLGIIEQEGKKTNELETVETEINENKIQAQTFLRNFRNEYPEIYRSISTRRAISSSLNNELQLINKLKNKGQIDISEAENMIESVEIRMKKLLEKPPTVAMPDVKKSLKSIGWLLELENSTSTKILKLLETRIFAKGDRIIKSNEHGKGMFIIVRGSAKVSIKDVLIDVIGRGSVIGEISILTGMKAEAEVIAESPLTTLWISSNDLKQIMYESKFLENKLWTSTGRRLAENFMISENKLNKQGIYTILKKGTLVYGTGQMVKATSDIVILLHGSAIVDNKTVDPGVIKDFTSIKLMNGSRLMVFQP